MHGVPTDDVTISVITSAAIDQGVGLGSGRLVGGLPTDVYLVISVYMGIGLVVGLAVFGLGFNLIM